MQRFFYRGEQEKERVAESLIAKSQGRKAFTANSFVILCVFVGN